MQITLIAKVLLSILVISLASLYVADSFAEKSHGTANPVTNSAKVCGITVCSEKMSIQEKIAAYMAEKFSSLEQQGRFQIGGVVQQTLKKSSIMVKPILPTDKIAEKSIPDYKAQKGENAEKFSGKAGDLGITRPLINTIDDGLPSTIRSVQSGHWDDPSIWEGGSVPKEYDTKIIMDVHDVRITDSWKNSGKIINNGNLFTGKLDDDSWPFDANFTVYNSGIIDNFGSIFVGGRSKIPVSDYPNDEIPTINSGTINNYGTIHSIGSFENHGTIYNSDSFILLMDKPFTNFGNITNVGFFGGTVAWTTDEWGPFVDFQTYPPGNIYLYKGNFENSRNLIAPIIMISESVFLHNSGYVQSDNLEINGHLENHGEIEITPYNKLKIGSTGVLDNMGIVNSFGDFEISGNLNISGFVNSTGHTYSAGTVFISNSGKIINTGILKNYASFYNNGNFTSYFGSFDNFGSMTNFGSFDNFGSKFVSDECDNGFSGACVPYEGYVYSYFTNSGNLENYGELINTGMIVNQDNSIIKNTGNMTNFLTLKNVGKIHNSETGHIITGSLLNEGDIDNLGHVLNTIVLTNMGNIVNKCFGDFAGLPIFGNPITIIPVNGGCLPNHPSVNSSYLLRP